MDIISHILIGCVLFLFFKKTLKSFFLIILFSFLPDLTQVAQYLYLGFVKERFLFIPLNLDWNGFRDPHPFFSALWDVPHSFFFSFIIILPIILYFKLPKIFFTAYFLHLFVDLFSHTGEWAVKPFYPLQYKFEGFANVWAWNLQSMAICWVIILLLITIIYLFQKNGRAGFSKN